MADIFNTLHYPKKFINPRSNGDEATKTVQKDKSVLWDTAAQEGALGDYLELTTANIECAVSYCKQKNGALKLLRHINFININIKPNKKYSTFAYNFAPKVELMLDGVEIKNEKLLSVVIKDWLELSSSFMNGATVVRSFYPSARFPALIEKIEVTNKTNSKVTFTATEITNRLSGKSNAIKTVSFGIKDGKLEVGSRVVDANGDFRSANPIGAKKLLVAGATGACYIIHYAIRKGETLNFNAEKEIKDYIKSLSTQNG